MNAVMNEAELILVIVVIIYSIVKKKKRQRLFDNTIILIKDRLYARRTTKLYIATVHILHLSVSRVVSLWRKCDAVAMFFSDGLH